MEENQVLFKRNVISFGDSFGTTLPKELIEYLKIQKGDKLVMVGKEKSKGRYIAVWKEEAEE